MKKPIIGIVSNSEFIPKGNYKKEVVYVNLDYINMINNNGGSPIIIPFENNINNLKNFLNNIDGLLLIGGEDISSLCYSKKGNPISKRDEFELEIYKYFKKMKKPILGICRGLQLINVAEGGTLTNITKSKIEHFIENDGWINYHEIKILNNTKLKQILKIDKYTASSVHHQKIDKLGKKVIISSVANDNIIESIEVYSDNFILGFQGHIEKCLTNYPKYNDIIKRFIKEAKK